MLAQPIESATAIGVATVVVLVGAYGLRLARASILFRVAAGLTAFVTGISLGYHLVTGDAYPLDFPFRLGIAAGLVGLGINQMAAPLRIASGRAA